MTTITVFKGNKSYTTDISIGDKYINTHHLEKGIRIATQETIDSILFTKAIAYGQCYLQKVI